MKIDIHVHTKKTKAGDSENRNINAERFDEIIKLTDVKILAITNHNHFDLNQYTQFRKLAESAYQIWPGVELDVFENGRRAHLIVIINPINVAAFDSKLNALLKNKSADTFTISIKDVIENFDKLDPIYITHYYAKKPNLLDEEVELLMSLVSNTKRVLKEATNSISAGIYISHGHRSIYGSDVQNWEDYVTIAKDLPDLRLPVESYEQFCLLLEKDDSTIKTILDKKSKENIEINPFGLAELIQLDLFNDINIIFGSKGTGKTEILKAISSYYNNIGYKTDVYESNSSNLNDVYDIKGEDFNINLEEFGVDDCTKELDIVKKATEKSITSLSNYLRYFSAEETNKISRNLQIKNYTIQDESSSKRALKDLQETQKKIKAFEDYVGSNNTLSKVIDKDLLNELTSVILRITEKIKTESEIRLFDLKSISLFNQIIKVFVTEISKKTGQPEKPIQTGFFEYATNRINIERSIRKIVDNISKKIDPIKEYAGDLGEKGSLYCQTNLTIQEGALSNSSYWPVRNVNKSPQKEVAKQLKTISKHVYSNELFEKISELIDIDGSATINSISDLLLFYRHFTLNDQIYRPSNGESSMVLLYNELKKDKEIYLIDEPEKSLGNDYINDVIVPLVKEKAQLGRKIIIATHDANIAVRTLPYNSIYRKHDIDQYYTYVGNPFSNNMICLTGGKENLDWKNISMKTLEGGKEAFGERGKIYGNI